MHRNLIFYVFSKKKSGSKILKMSFIRVLLAILFPPLSIVDKGCGSFFIVFLLTLCG